MSKIHVIKQQAARLQAGYLSEYRETVTMLGLLCKKDKSHDDRLFIRRQSRDIVRIGIMTGIVALPGGAFLLAAVETGLRRMNRTLMPSAFTPDQIVEQARITLIAVRHGESEANVACFINDDPTRPIALTDTGREQARQAGIALQAVAFNAAYVSEFPRAQQTAHLLLANRSCPLHVDPRINERISGMDGRHVDEFNNLVLADPVNTQPPQGESFRQQMVRVGRFMDDLKQRHPHGSTVLIVSHENPIMAMRAISGADPESAALDHLGNGEWITLAL